MAIRHARAQRSKVLAICNTNGATIPRESDAVIYTHAGPEIGVASTKGFLTQLVACYLLGLYLAQVRGTKFGDEIASVVHELEKMPGHLQAVLDRSEAGLCQLARELAGAKSVLFLGRHAGFPVALEGALKLKELAYIHAEGFAAGELKHGPIALIEDGLPVFCVVPPRGRDQLHDKMISAIQEIRARGARTIVLAEEGDESVAPYADTLIPLPRVPTLLQPLVAVVPLQLFACELATAAGPRRRPAAQPGQVRHGRVTVDDRGRRHRRGRHRPVRRVAGAHARRCASGCSPPPRPAPIASLAARFAAKEAIAKALGAPAGSAGTTPRWSARPPGGRASRSAARCWSPRTPWACAACTSRCPTTAASRRPSWSSSREAERALDRTPGCTTRYAERQEVGGKLLVVVADLTRGAPDNRAAWPAETALSREVVLPVLDVHVEAAVDLEDDHMPVRQHPFTVGEARTARRVDSPALSRGCHDADAAAPSTDVDLGHRPEPHPRCSPSVCLNMTAQRSRTHDAHTTQSVVQRSTVAAGRPRRRPPVRPDETGW